MFEGRVFVYIMLFDFRVTVARSLFGNFNYANATDRSCFIQVERAKNKDVKIMGLYVYMLHKKCDRGTFYKCISI